MPTALIRLLCRPLWPLWLGLLSAPAMASGLAELVDAALARHPTAAQWQAQARQFDAEAATAQRWFPAPAELSLSGQGDQWHDNTGQREWDVELATPLWRPGQQRQQQQATRQTRQRWQAGQTLLRLTLAGQVREAVWDLQESLVKARLAKERVQIADQLASDVARRVEAGELAQIDSLLAQGDRLSALDAADAAQQQALQAQSRLLRLTGQTTAPSSSIETAAVDDPAQRDADLLKNHPRIKNARLEAAASRSTLEVTRSDRPAPTAALVWSQERDDRHADYAQQAGLKLSLPLGGARYNRAAVARAEADALAADANLQQVRADVEQDIRLARDALQRARQQLQRARQRDELARQNLALSRRAFDAGERDLLSLLKLQADALTARENRELGTIALHRATARFNQALGVLP